MPTEFLTHDTPVWQHRANYIIHARLDEESPQRYEQLWARKVGLYAFEICCIPFFVYNLSLGDEVVTGCTGEDEFVVEKVVNASGRYTFRVWLGSSTCPEVHTILKDTVERYYLSEWYSDNLIAIDAPNQQHAEALSGLLLEGQDKGYWIYETGRTM